MTDKKNFIKVRVWLILKDGDKLTIMADGTFIPSNEFSERSYTYDEIFREPIMVLINESVGLHNWAVRFEQFAEDDSIYDVRIYADDEMVGGRKIKNIIEDKIPNKELKFYYGGTINDYLKQ